MNRNFNPGTEGNKRRGGNFEPAEPGEMAGDLFERLLQTKPEWKEKIALKDDGILGLIVKCDAVLVV